MVWECLPKCWIGWPDVLLESGHRGGTLSCAICPAFRLLESSIPTRAAVVAAPILKLCLANWSWGRPRLLSLALILVVNADLVTGLPDGLRKNGPGGCFLLTSTKFRIAWQHRADFGFRFAYKYVCPPSQLVTF